MILQLNPPIPLDTPRGKAFAHVLIDYGQEHHLLWVCFIDETGECRAFQNPEVRLQHNETMGRPQFIFPTEKTPEEWRVESARNAANARWAKKQNKHKTGQK
jgi:hypothetical protein